MATTCFSVVRGKTVRVVELDDCGAPLEGGRYVVSDGFVSVALTAELESGDEYIQKNANGKLCINERNPDALKRLNVEIDWCNVDPELISIVTGNPVELDNETDAVGFRITEGEADTNWGLEVWTGIAGDNCGESGPSYGYLLVPFITGSTVGDITIENGVSTFQTLGYTQGNSGWDDGIWAVVGTNESPTLLDDPITAVDHALLRVTHVDPPTAACGATPITSV